MIHYTVVKGDTLSKIAAAHGGFKWQLIVKANPSVIKDGDPRTMQPGNILHIDPAWAVIPPPPPPPPPPPSGWGDGKSFLDRPLESNQIRLDNQSDIVIENLRFENRPYVSGQGNSHVSIYLNNCSNITIRNCDFEDISEAVAIFGGSNITVEWCRANNILGPSQPRVGYQTGNFLQTVGSPSSVVVQDCKLVVGPNGDTEDIVSFYSANSSILRRTQIDGTGWASPNGTGAILGDNGGSNNLIEDVTMLNPGQVGAAIAGGQNNTVRRTTVYRVASDPSPGQGNVGMYAMDFSGAGWSGHRFEENHVRYWSSRQNVWNGIYNPDGFPEVDCDFNDTTIDPDALVVVL